MGSLGRRVQRLEKVRGGPRLGAPATLASEAEKEREKRDWLARRQIWRNEKTSDDVKHARDLIRLFRAQNILSQTSARELTERIVSWRPLPEGGRSWTATEREVALAIYNQEPGTESMGCPPEWRESFVAADEVRAKFAAMPDEVIAYEGGFGKDVRETYGISEELEERVMGPSYVLGELPKETKVWIIQETLEEIFYGERAYRIDQLLRQDPERARAAFEKINALASKGVL